MEFFAGPHRLQWGERPLIMGIVNVTPDSFYDGGRFIEPEAAVAQAVRLVAEGADILDIGAESTRPGASPLDEDEELRRVVPVIRALSRAVSTPLSIDTMKAAVAEAAVAEGASIINDVTSLRGDAAMVGVAAKTGAGLVLMHMQGTPRTMQQSPYYRNVVQEVAEFFAERIDFATARGVARRQIVLDPGIGFGKLLEHNLDLLAHLGTFLPFGCPVMIGVSRKGFLGQLTNRSVEDRLWSSAAAVALAVQQRVSIIRVHDVAAMRDAATVAAAIAGRQTFTRREQHA